jgi:hypothetical protein
MLIRYFFSIGLRLTIVRRILRPYIYNISKCKYAYKHIFVCLGSWGYDYKGATGFPPELCFLYPALAFGVRALP